MNKHCINVIEHIWNRTDGERFAYFEILGQELCELAEQHIAIVDNSIVSDDGEISELKMMVCFLTSRMETDYDYDYEDNIVSNNYEETVYIPIAYCPFCGAKFEINVTEVINDSSDFNLLWAEYEALNKGRSSKEKTKKQNELYSKMFNEKNKWVILS